MSADQVPHLSWSVRLITKLLHFCSLPLGSPPKWRGVGSLGGSESFVGLQWLVKADRVGKGPAGLCCGDQLLHNICQAVDLCNLLYSCTVRRPKQRRSHDREANKKEATSLSLQVAVSHTGLQLLCITSVSPKLFYHTLWDFNYSSDHPVL